MDAEMKRFLIQTRPAAFRTYSRLGKLVGPFLRGSRSILVLHHLDILHDSFVKDKIVGSGMDKRTFDFQTLITAIQYFIDDILRQLAHRSLQRSLITFQQSLDLPENHRILVLSQRRDGFLRTPKANGRVSPCPHQSDSHSPAPCSAGTHLEAN